MTELAGIVATASSMTLKVGTVPGPQRPKRRKPNHGYRAGHEWSVWTRGRLRAVTAAVAASAMMALAACTSPGEGTITDSPALTPSESTTPEPVYAFEVFGDICPSAEVIPDQIAAPDAIGYIAETQGREESFYYSHKCTYDLDDEMKSLDGTDALYRLGIDFHVTDGSPLELTAPGAFSSVDFEEADAAEYFRDWDQAVVSSEHDASPTGYELEESDYVLFQFSASIDNLYVYAGMSFVVTDEDHDMEPDLDTDEAAYQILEAIVAPVVAELERQ